LNQCEPKFLEQFTPDAVKRGAIDKQSIQYLFHFDNGYGASIIKSKYSYGGRQGLWELAVLKDKQICYSTHITDDVIGYIDDHQAMRYLVQISCLPSKT
jgi:hypothetical protein